MSLDPQRMDASLRAAHLRTMAGRLAELLPPAESGERLGSEVAWDSERHGPAVRALLDAVEVLGRTLDAYVGAVEVQGRVEKALRARIAEIELGGPQRRDDLARWDDLRSQDPRAGLAPPPRPT